MSLTTIHKYSSTSHTLENLSIVRYIYTFFPYLSFNHLGKDIEIALTEIREQQNALYDLKRKDESKTKVIGNLSQENYRLSE